MKKTVLFFVITLVAFLFSSCSKQIDSIAGTTWIGADGGTAMQLTFTQTEFELKDMNTPGGFYGSYAYNKPAVTLIITKYIDANGVQKTGGASMTGTVSGNTMTLTYEGASSTATFVKQK